jgi:hypothetical protein
MYTNLSTSYVPTYIILCQFFAVSYYCVVGFFKEYLYILGLYLNTIDALMPCGNSHGWLSKASGHGSINTSYTSHLVSKMKKKTVIYQK